MKRRPPQLGPLPHSRYALHVPDDRQMVCRKSSNEDGKILDAELCLVNGHDRVMELEEIMESLADELDEMEADDEINQWRHDPVREVVMPNTWKASKLEIKALRRGGVLSG
jgi:hypothetical protein